MFIEQIREFLSQYAHLIKVQTEERSRIFPYNLPPESLITVLAGNLLIPIGIAMGTQEVFKVYRTIRDTREFLKNNTRDDIIEKVFTRNNPFAATIRKPRPETLIAMENNGYLHKNEKGQMTITENMLVDAGKVFINTHKNNAYSTTEDHVNAILQSCFNGDKYFTPSAHEVVNTLQGGEEFSGRF
jgi:hypothetical protein